MALGTWIHAPGDEEWAFCRPIKIVKKPIAGLSNMTRFTKQGDISTCKPSSRPELLPAAARECTPPKAAALGGLGALHGGGGASTAAAALSLKKRVRELVAEPKLGWTCASGRSQADSWSRSRGSCDQSELTVKLQTKPAGNVWIWVD